MNNDLISREALKENEPHYDEEGYRIFYESEIDNAPTVAERPQGELTEIKHRLNLLIGVLYSNQLISQSDFDYMEDSIKKLMKGGAE